MNVQVAIPNTSDLSMAGAAASLREGLDEMFTINRLGLPASLRRSLATTNIIESPHSGVRMRTRRVTNWKDGSMVLRWAAFGFLATEKNFRRMMGYRDLWILAAALGRNVDDEDLAAQNRWSHQPTIHYGWGRLHHSARS